MTTMILHDARKHPQLDVTDIRLDFGVYESSSIYSKKRKPVLDNYDAMVISLIVMKTDGLLAKYVKNIRK